MTDILENELVRRYFGCEDETPRPEQHTLDRLSWDGSVSRRVLRAMQEPIRKGTKFLQFWNAKWLENRAMDDSYTTDSFHPNYLVLPDRFQAGNDDWCSCPCGSSKHRSTPPAPEKWGENACSNEDKPADAGRCYCVKGNDPQAYKFHSADYCGDLQRPHDSEKKPYCGKCHVELTDNISAQMHMNCHKESDSAKAVEYQDCGCKKGGHYGSCGLRQTELNKAVEMKIKELVNLFSTPAQEHWLKALRELVELARK